MEVRRRRRREDNSKNFRYEAMWSRDETYEQMVQEAWDESALIRTHNGLLGKIAHMSVRMKEWSIAKFGSVKKELKENRDRIQQLLHFSSQEAVEERRLLHARLNELLHREEIMWRQRSRQLWLTEGDRNT